MSWSEPAPGRTGRFSRSVRPNFVAPHLRSTSTQRGGYGRGRGGGYQPHYQNWYSNPSSEPFDDVAEKFNELEVNDEGSGGGTNFDAYEDIPVEATGADVLVPVASFAEIDLGEAVNANIVRCKYTKPTPVQRHAIPIAAAGRDLMACAQTGSGKTAAFCFPIISGIMRGRQVAGGKGVGGGGGAAKPLALILSPTRELSCQIYEEARKFSYQTGVKIVVAYGGAPISQQLRNLEKGVDILVATPGRLVDMIERQRVSLKMIKYLALDEADRMLDMGFEPQIRKIVERMDMPPPGSRQTLLFSATFPSEIQKLASDFLSNYIFLSVGKVGSSTDLIAQKVEFVQEIDKKNCLMGILQEQTANGSGRKLALTLIFVETKRGADALERWLSRSGFPAIAIHGDKVQMEREQALKSFKSGATPVLVATDVASRGLDIPNVAHVINFDMPKDIDDYVHRIGRTGRAGKSGLATAFFSDKNAPLAKSLVELMQEAKQEVPSWLTEYANSNSSYSNAGKSRRYGGNKFGGHDFRNNNQNQYGNGDNQNYYSGSYGNDFGNNNQNQYGNENNQNFYSGSHGGDFGSNNQNQYGNGDNQNYYSGSCGGDGSSYSADTGYANYNAGYMYDNGTVVATGWE